MLDSDACREADLITELDEDEDEDFHTSDSESTKPQDSQEDSEMEGETYMEDSRDIALKSIENLVCLLLNQLNKTLPHTDREDDATNAKRRIQIDLADRRKVTADGSVGMRSLRYPLNGKGSSAKPIAQLFRVLDIVYEALIQDVPCTKRDIYYKDVSLFKSQTVVDRLIDDIAATFELRRADLNIRATSKGLVSSSGFVIHLNEGGCIRANDSEGILIPVGEDIRRFEVPDNVAWVLVVEKDAVFQTLCRIKLSSHPLMPGPGILITGKGYPDIATRELVSILAENLPLNTPILVLVDGDAYGIDILSVYKFGSQSLSHEKERLIAERVEWLGICASQLSDLNIDKDALVHITRHDEKKALSMLRRPESVMPIEWKNELMYLLHTRRKAEIEILSSVPALGSSFQGGESGNYLLQYLVTRISDCVHNTMR